MLSNTRAKDFKQQVARHFGKAASNYCQHHQIQQQVGMDLLALKQKERSNTLLDVGCGPGSMTEPLQQICQHYWGMDLSLSMLTQAPKPSRTYWLCGDAEQLPVADNSMDCCFANLSLQWVTELPQALRELHRVLTPQGQALVSIPIAGTFKEFSQCWQQAGSVARARRFMSLSDINNELHKAGIKRVDIHQHQYQQNFLTVADLLQSIKGVGANYVADQQPENSYLSPQMYRRFSAAYEHFRTDVGLPLSWSVVLLGIKK